MFNWSMTDGDADGYPTVSFYGLQMDIVTDHLNKNDKKSFKLSGRSSLTSWNQEDI